MFEEAALRFKGKILFTWIDSKEEDLYNKMAYVLNVKPEDWPVYMILKPRGNHIYATELSP